MGSRFCTGAIVQYVTSAPLSRLDHRLSGLKELYVHAALFYFLYCSLFELSNLCQSATIILPLSVYIHTQTKINCLKSSYIDLFGRFPTVLCRWSNVHHILFLNTAELGIVAPFSGTYLLCFCRVHRHHHHHFCPMAGSVFFGVCSSL